MKRSTFSQFVLGVMLLAAVALLFRRDYQPANAQDSAPQIVPPDSAPFTVVEESFDPPTATLADTPEPGGLLFSEPAGLLSSESTAITPVDEKTQLQQRYVDLATERAQMMTLAELQTEIQAAEVATNEVAARRELEQARAILSRLLDKHPTSEAATQARRMLGTDDVQTSDFDKADSAEAASDENGLFPVDSFAPPSVHDKNPVLPSPE